MASKTSLFIGVSLLAAAGHAQALTAQNINIDWVRRDANLRPQNIQQALDLLAMTAASPGFLAATTTTASRVDFFDGSDGSGGLRGGSILDPFTNADGLPNTDDDDAVFAVRVTGDIGAPTDGVFSLIVHSDDGFRLRIGGQDVSSFDGNRSPDSTRIDGIALSAGAHAFELIGWEQGGQFALEFSWAPDGAPVEAFTVLGDTPQPVPLTGALPFLGMALAGLGARARRR